MKKLWACHTFTGNPSKDVKVESSKMKVASNDVKKDKEKLEGALKGHAEDEEAVKHNNEVEQYAEMEINKQQSVLNKWSAEEAKTSKFPSGKQFDEAAEQVKQKMEHARDALKVAKAVVRFAKFKKVVANKKADETVIQIEHIRHALKLSQSQLKKDAADEALDNAATANEDKFSWDAQKKFWEKDEAKKKMQKANIVVAASKAEHKDMVEKFGKGSPQVCKCMRYTPLPTECNDLPDCRR